MDDLERHLRDSLAERLDAVGASPPRTRDALVAARRRRTSKLAVGALLSLATLATAVILVPSVGENVRRDDLAATPCLRIWNVDLVVYVKTANNSEIAMLRRAIARHPRVEAFEFVSRREAMREFQEVYEDNPEFWMDLPANASPATFRIELVDPSDGALVTDDLRKFPAFDAAYPTAQDHACLRPEPQPEVSKTRRDEVPPLSWPPPFEPPTTTTGTREEVTLVYPDKTAVRISYPRRVALASMGIQPTVSYAIDGKGPNDIIFVRGALPRGLVDPAPLATYGDKALHRLTYELSGAEYVLTSEIDGWTIVILLPDRPGAPVIAENIVLSVSAEGYPSVFALGPVQLSEGFGEERGPHIEFGDADPTFGVVKADVDFTYVVSGVVKRCSDSITRLEKTGTDWYGSRCLDFAGGSPGVFFSVYGPESFVRAVVQGLRLEM